MPRETLLSRNYHATKSNPPQTRLSAEPLRERQVDLGPLKAFYIFVNGLAQYPELPLPAQPVAVLNQSTPQRVASGWQVHGQQGPADWVGSLALRFPATVELIWFRLDAVILVRQTKLPWSHGYHEREELTADFQETEIPPVSKPIPELQSYDWVDASKTILAEVAELCDSLVTWLVEFAKSVHVCGVDSYLKPNR